MQRVGVLFVLIGALFIGAVLFVLFGDSIVSAASRLFAATPSETGDIEIVLTDFSFTPNVIRVKAGQKVRITLRNEGLHTHEFMVGKRVHVEDGITEPPMPDFFAGVHVEITGTGMAMGFEGMEEMHMEGMEMGEGMQMGEGEGMAMGEEPMHKEETMPMGEEPMHKEETMPMEEGARVVLPGAHAEGMAMDMDEHHGSMVMLDPGHTSTLVLTIPEDKVGTWIFGCFQEEGLHFDDGMRGVLIVEK
jgi:hypothetical protein